MLHELLFAHCNNKSDQAVVPAIERARDIADSNCAGASCADAAALKHLAASRSLRPVCAEIIADFDRCFDNIGFSPLVSAHPPPFS